MAALLSLLLAIALPDTTLDDVAGRWVTLTPRTEVFAPNLEIGPDSVRIQTLAELLEITADTLVSTVVYQTQPPHGSGETEAIQLRDAYRADGRTLLVDDETGRSARYHLARDGSALVLSLPDPRGIPPLRYRRPQETDALVGLWTGRTSVVDVGIAFDVELSLRLRADGTVALEVGGRPEADPSVGPDYLVIGPYVLLADPSTTDYGAPGGTELAFFTLAELSDDGEHLRWTSRDGTHWRLRRAPNAADR